MAGLELTTLSKKRRADDEVFMLEVRGRENFEILSKIRDSLELAQMIPQPQVDAYKKQRNDAQKQWVANSDVHNFCYNPNLAHPYPARCMRCSQP